MRVLDAGDGALTLEFGDSLDPEVLARVHGLDGAITGWQARGELPGLIEVVPTFRSLTLLYDPLVTRQSELLERLQSAWATVEPVPPASGRSWRFPVCYEGEWGVDLAECAQALGLPVADLLARHAAAQYQVLMLGFLPGFAFMGGVPEGLRLPRRAEPRVRVPAGSVAMAGELTAIYPWESPGGWHLLGHCPVPLFRLQGTRPALLEVGDRVAFEAVSEKEHGRLRAAIQGGEISPEAWLVKATRG